MTASARVCPSCRSPLTGDALFCSRCGASTPTGIQQETGRIEGASAVATSAPDQRDRLQRVLGDGYEVRELLGSGGFAEVYAAFDLRLKRPVAVKVLRTDLALSPVQLQRFRREAEAVANLRHPGIVPIYSVGEAEGLAYYVMPLVRGESLRARVEREGPLAIPEAVRILKELAGALADAHKVGLVHRDIKPDNVMLEGEERRALLMDFGIAKALGDAQGNLTATGMIIGTPHYMSPEQASGEREIDHRSDIYSLGVLAWQILIGRLPFEGDSAQMVLMKQITAPAERVDRVREDAPVELGDAIERCLAKKPAERWATAGELLSSLKALSGPAVARPRERMGRRLRGWNRRRAYLAAAGVLVLGLGYLGLFKRHVVWSAMDYWVGFTAPGADTTSNAVATWLRGWGDRDRNQLLSIGDTLLLVMAPPFQNSYMGLALFDGTGWRTLRVPSDRIGAAVSLGRGEVALFEWQFEQRAGARLLLEGGLAKAQDSVPFPVTGAWSDGDNVVVTGSAGEVAANSGRGWQRQPTGTRARLSQPFGTARDDLYAIGSFGRVDRPDSLLHFDGFRWRAVDIRPDTSVQWTYNAGVALDDGDLVVVGHTGRVGSPLEQRRPLILVRDSTRRWREVATELPAELRPWGVWGRTRNQLLLWGGSPVSTSPTLFEVRDTTVSPVVEVAGFGVAGAATLRGQPYVLLEDGTLWTKRRGGWGVVGEVPSSLVLDEAGDDSVGVNVGVRLFVGPELGQLTLDVPETFVRAAVRRPSVWLLASSGRVYEHRCRTLPGIECRTRLLPPPGRAAPADLGLLPDGRPFVVGPAGLLSAWSGSAWANMAVPDTARGEDFRRLSAEPGRVPTVIGHRSLLQLDSAGAWRVVATMPERIGTPRHVATFPFGGVAVVGDRDVGLWSRRLGTLVLVNSYLIRPAKVSRLLALSDGRLVVATAEPDDPLLGGSLFISSPVSDTTRELDWSTIRELPARVDVYGLRQVGEWLHVTGSGWLNTGESINRLTPPDSSRRGS